MRSSEFRALPAVSGRGSNQPKAGPSSVVEAPSKYYHMAVSRN